MGNIRYITTATATSTLYLTLTKGLEEPYTAKFGFVV